MLWGVWGGEVMCARRSRADTGWTCMRRRRETYQKQGGRWAEQCVACGAVELSCGESREPEVEPLRLGGPASQLQILTGSGSLW